MSWIATEYLELFGLMRIAGAYPVVGLRMRRIDMTRNTGAILKAWRRSVRSLRQDEQGFTAVEFGMVATPFLMFLFGIINVGLMYFTTFTIENATESAARAIRTGQVKTMGTDALGNPTGGPATKENFKKQVCDRVPGFVDCAGKLRVDVQVVADGAAPSPPAGSGSGTLKTDAQMGYPGSFSGGQIVLVTTFYQWDMAKFLPFLNVGSSSMGDGSRLIRATVAFKNEPY
jgi:Flp pilus assembly protein TadG